MTKNIAAIQTEIRGAAANDGATAGTVMDDGSVFAGTTKDGNLIYALPKGIGFTATFKKAARAVGKLNETKALGHDDWQIPDLDTLEDIQKNQNQTALKGAFNAVDKGSGSVYPDWYWSSTQSPDGSSYVYDVRFSLGCQIWGHKDRNRLSCLPVRIVAPNV